MNFCEDLPSEEQSALEKLSLDQADFIKIVANLKRMLCIREDVRKETITRFQEKFGEEQTEALRELARTMISDDYIYEKENIKKEMYFPIKKAIFRSAIADYILRTH